MEPTITQTQRPCYDRIVVNVPVFYSELDTRSLAAVLKAKLDERATKAGIATITKLKFKARKIVVLTRYLSVAEQNIFNEMDVD